MINQDEIQSLNDLKSGLELQKSERVQAWLKHKYETLYQDCNDHEDKVLADERQHLQTEIIGKLSQNAYNLPSNTALDAFYLQCNRAAEAASLDEFMKSNKTSTKLTDTTQAFIDEMYRLQARCYSLSRNYSNVRNQYIRHENRSGHNTLEYNDAEAGRTPAIFNNDKFAGLRGDTLKTVILNALATELSNCPRTQLPDLIDRIRGSYEHRLLQQRQNPWMFGTFFKSQTDSVTELERMIDVVRPRESEHMTRVTQLGFVNSYRSGASGR